MNEEDSSYSSSLIREKMNKSLYPNNELYPRYDKNIIIETKKDESIFHYQYDNIKYKIIVSNKYHYDYLSLFEKGILNPQLIRCFKALNMTIGQFTEISIQSKGTKRHYKLWIWDENTLNPCEYRIELLNINATEHTLTKEFIQDAIIVHISECRIII